MSQHNDNGATGQGRLEALFSSATPEWATPQELFDELNAEFQFTLDPCCTPQNAKCAKHYTAQDNGLTQDWGRERVWMNPPYGREIGRWVEKAVMAAQRGALVVCLLPFRADTRWWHQYCTHGEVRLMRGRIKFGAAKTGAPFPSTLVIFRPCRVRQAGECVLPPRGTWVRMEVVRNRDDERVRCPICGSHDIELIDTAKLPPGFDGSEWAARCHGGHGGGDYLVAYGSEHGFSVLSADKGVVTHLDHALPVWDEREVA